MIISACWEASTGMSRTATSKEIGHNYTKRRLKVLAILYAKRIFVYQTTEQLDNLREPPKHHDHIEEPVVFNLIMFSAAITWSRQ